MHRALLLLLFFFASSLAAQQSLSIAPQQCVWRQGDDLRWASPNLDESGWHPASQWTTKATPTPNFWLRCSFQPGQLAPAVHPVLLVAGDLAWQVFVDGRSIGESGNLVTGSHTAGIMVEYDAPELATRNRPILVAVRMTFTPLVNAVEAFPELALGDAELQRDAYDAQVSAQVRQQWITWACHVLILSAGLFFLVLFWFDRAQRYVLWIALCWLAFADLRLNEFLVAASVHYPARLEFFLYALGQTAPAFVILFSFSLNYRPLPRIFKAILAVNLVMPVLLLVAVFLPLRWSMMLRWQTELAPWANTIVVVATMAALLSLLFAFWPLRTLRKELVPLAAVCFIWMTLDLTYLAVQFPFLHLDVIAMFLKIQPYRSVAIAAVVVSITLLLIHRIRTTNRERALLHGEMQAARHIQRLLVPETIDSTAGWKIDAVFLPARDVGGDFYLCRPLPDGRQRIMLGDVSGKGTAAAMTAALLIGAAEGRAGSPSQLLNHLNQVLRDSRVGGFATCLCADFAHDGTVVLASAGHLAPYYGGSELKVESGLPLGLDVTASYGESVFQFAPGTQLTLLTDGVVEAQNGHRELFGFDRTAAISNQTADAIARAAQAFGQQDDITVLTLTLVPVAVATV